jgi:hypothetical protein
LFSCFLIKEVIVVVVVGDGSGCGRRRGIHLFISCYNVTSIKQQASFCCSSPSWCSWSKSSWHFALFLIMMFMILVLEFYFALILVMKFMILVFTHFAPHCCNVHDLGSHMFCYVMFFIIMMFSILVLASFVLLYSSSLWCFRFGSSRIVLCSLSSWCYWS